MVGRRHVSTPVKAARRPSSWCRFGGSGLPVHHFEVWRHDQRGPVFICGCMRRRTGRYDAKLCRWTRSRPSWCAVCAVGNINGRSPVFSNRLASMRLFNILTHSLTHSLTHTHIQTEKYTDRQTSSNSFQLQYNDILRSANSRTCVITRTYSQFGDWCFATAGPKLCISLPVQLRQADVSYEQFKRLLKTFLFGTWDRGTLWLTVTVK